MTPEEQMEREANARLSNYEGGDNYVGANDDALSFTGGKSFLTEHKSKLTFGYKIVNLSAATKLLVLHEGYFTTIGEISNATGVSADAIVTDGVFLTSNTATASQSKYKIAPWKRFLLRNPHRVVELVIDVNDKALFAEYLNVQVISPYRQLENKTYLLSDFVDPKNFNTTKAIIPFDDLQLDDQVLVYLNIGGTDVVATYGGSMTFSFRMGALKSNAAELDQKAKRANRVIEKKMARYEGE